MGGKRKRSKASSSSSSVTPDEQEGSKRRPSSSSTSKHGSRTHHQASATSTNMWGSGSGSSSRRRGGSSRGSSSGGAYRSSSHSGSSSSGVNETAVVKMFAKIADDDDPYVASMEGISKLCEDLGIDPLEDVRILVLLWKMGATEKPAQINKDEWIRGCAKLQVDSIDKFKALLPALDTGFLDRTEFKDFYKFCFQFNRQGTHRTLDKDLVIALLQIVVKNRIDDERLATFCEFLEQQRSESYSRITLDQWTSFLDFCYEVEDIADYDEATSAWPVLIDEYVEFMERRSR